MFSRFSNGARSALTAGYVEADRLGDRQLNSDHLLLGLLHDPSSRAAAALGTDLDTARRARNGLDRAALVAVGVDVTDLELGELDPAESTRGGGRRRFSAAAADALRRTVSVAAQQRSRTLEPEHLLLGLLDAELPDPAAELLAALDLDPAVVKGRLCEAA